MADIVKLNDKPRDKPWRARIRRKGHKPIIKMFRTKNAAELWARKEEDHIERFDFPSLNPMMNETLGQKENKELGIKDGILWRYIKTVTPEKGCYKSENAQLRKFADRDICRLSLKILSSTNKYAYEYRDMRLKETYLGKQITPRTVRREITSIAHVFTKAKMEWGYDSLNNPFKGMEIKGSNFKRTRALKIGEYGKLIAACKHCNGLNKYYAPAVITFAITTGMRLQEIFNLKWTDVDRQARTVTVRESKTDKLQGIPGRVIVLPYIVEYLLMNVARAQAAQTNEIIELAGKRVALAQQSFISSWEKHIESGRIFPMSKEAFTQTFRDTIVKNAGIPSREEDQRNGVPEHAQGLEFLDLRREAGSMFVAADLNSEQHDLMLGHNNNKIRGVYIAPSPQVVKSIADKIDRHLLEFTKDEFEKQYAEEKERELAIATAANVVDIFEFRNKKQEKDIA
jgi:integrase